MIIGVVEAGVGVLMMVKEEINGENLLQEDKVMTEEKDTGAEVDRQIEGDAVIHVPQKRNFLKRLKCIQFMTPKLTT